jgi:hypothetical protein
LEGGKGMTLDDARSEITKYAKKLDPEDIRKLKSFYPRELRKEFDQLAKDKENRVVKDQALREDREKDKREAAAKAEQEAQEKSRIDKLRKIVKVSKSLEIGRLASVLEIDEKKLWDRIFDWAEQFGFQIEKDTVIFGQGNTAGFMEELDKAFSTWDAKSRTKDGKI